MPFWCYALKLFFNLCIYFNWRLIISQYCSGFCHTLTWISHGYTCVSQPQSPSRLPPHPIPHHRLGSLALSALSHASNSLKLLRNNIHIISMSFFEGLFVSNHSSFALCFFWAATDVLFEVESLGTDIGKDVLKLATASYIFFSRYVWRQEEKGTTEDEMVGWHHQLDGHEFEQALVMDREAWHAAVHEVTKSWTWLSNWAELRNVWVIL